MVSSNAIRAGAAYIELSVSDSRFVKGLRAASAKLNEFGSGLTALGTGMTAIGGAVTAPLMAAATAFATAGDTLAKASDRTGLSVEALSELSFASQLAGTNFEELETGLKNMQRTLGAAFAGTGTVAEKLTVLGLSVEKLSGLSPEAQFEAIAKAISRVADPTVRAAAAVDIFGRNGTKLIPLMQNLQALRGEARSLG
ncbi:MAG: hypothetical protein N3A38_13025, partial [Planctomycetota bacterium]|nr:hypothetical protein [Planctomycetota bacterium]